MRRVAVVGVGRQGAKTVQAAAGDSAAAVHKIYVNAPNSDIFCDGSDIMIPFSYEMGAWSPEYPLKVWFSEPDHLEMLDSLFRNEDIIVICAGLGGIMSLAAKHLILYLKECYPQKTVYFAGTIPFREESDYLCNFLCGKMMDFLRGDIVPYTILENRIVRAFYQQYEKAYDRSCRYLAKIVEGFVSISARVENQDLKDFLGRGLVFYNELTISGAKLQENQESIMSYDAEGTGVFGVILARELNMAVFQDTSRIWEQFEDRYGSIEGRFEEEKTIDRDKILVRVVARGTENRGRGLRIRTLQI